jgi:hypothetical protein
MDGTKPTPWFRSPSGSGCPHFSTEAPPQVDHCPGDPLCEGNPAACPSCKKFHKPWHNPGPSARWCPTCRTWRYCPVVHVVPEACGITLSSECGYVPTCYKCGHAVEWPTTYDYNNPA